MLYYNVSQRGTRRSFGSNWLRARGDTGQVSGDCNQRAGTHVRRRRESEVALLEAFLRRDDAPRALVLVGGAGIGKTTLWETGSRSPRRRGSACSPPGRPMPRRSSRSARSSTSWTRSTPRAEETAGAATPRPRRCAPARRVHGGTPRAADDRRGFAQRPACAGRSRAASRRRRRRAVARSVFCRRAHICRAPARRRGRHLPALEALRSPVRPRAAAAPG